MPDPLKAAYDLLKRRISKTQLIALLVSSPQQFAVFSDLEAWKRSPFLHPAQTAALVKFACLYADRKRWVRRLDHRRYDMAKLANPYKELWQLAESVSPYSDDPELLGTFLLRFVYQQLP